MTKTKILTSGFAIMLMLLFSSIVFAGCSAPSKVVDVDFDSVYKITIKAGKEVSESTEYVLTDVQKGDFLEKYGVLDMAQQSGLDNVAGKTTIPYTFTVYYNKKILWLFNSEKSFTVIVSGYSANPGSSTLGSWSLKRKNGLKTSWVAIKVDDKDKFTLWFDELETAAEAD